jgi:hypothetical protein
MRKSNTSKMYASGGMYRIKENKKLREETDVRNNLNE